jgi:hypothetical protein
MVRNVDTNGTNFDDDIMTNDDDTPTWDTHTVASGAVQAAEGTGFAFLEKGGRTKTTCDWNFKPYVLPAVVNVDQHPEDSGVESGLYTITDAYNGENNLFIIMNPKVRSKTQPVGAILGAVSKRYAGVSYPEVFAPLAMHCNEQGWDFKITAYDFGKKARMDINVVANEKNTLTNVGDLYRYGVTIHNSLDGSGSFKISGVAERLACTNGMVATSTRNLASFRHTKNGVGKIDFAKLSNSIAGMIKDVEQELELVETMTSFGMDNELFGKLLVAARERKIISLPQATPMIHKQSETVVDYSITRGYGFRAALMGWNRPEADFVKVEGEAIGTAYHAYNVLTGVLTHKPTWSGANTLSGKGNAVLTGSALAIGALDTRLHAVHKLMSDVVSGVVNLEDYVTPMEAMGVTL